MSQARQKRNSFFGGAAILTAGIVIVKIIGALYKIPLGNILSDVGFANFNTAYNIYSLLIIISTGGLPVALSKMVSEANALNRGNQVKKVFRLAFLTFMVLGIICCGIMTLFSKQLAGFMRLSTSYYSILALAPALFFLSPLSAFRGYFQGHALMTPTAVSQIIEALCKLVVGLALSAFLLSHGSDEAVAAAGAIFGVSVGCALASVYVLFCYRRYRQGVPETADRPDSTRSILSTLAKLAIPITLSSSVIAITNILDTRVLLGRLQDALLYTEDAAAALKGVYDKALTLYNLPAAFMTALTASVIPHVAGAIASKNYRLSAQLSETTLRTTALIAMPAGFGLCALGEPIIRLLYPATDVALAGWMLSVLGIASITVCFMLVCNSILQAHQIVTIPMITTIIGCAMKLLVGYVLTGNPDIGIKGGAISTIVCFGLIALLDLVIVKLALPRSLSYVRAFAKPLIASVVMGLAAWAAYGLLSHVLLAMGPFRTLTADGAGQMLTGTGNAVAVLGAIAVGGIVYLVLILVTKAISKEDLSFMPKGDKLARLLRLR